MVARLAGAGRWGRCSRRRCCFFSTEYLPLSFNVHEDLGDTAPRSPTRRAVFLNWMMPRISPTGPLVYSWTRNWVGAGTMFLAVAVLTTAAHDS